MTVPNLPRVEGTIRDVSPLLQSSPYLGRWITSSTVSGVTADIVGWLVAQGWQIIGTYEEDDVTYYNMGMARMNPWLIIQSLLHEYTKAYNEGRRNNSYRYNDVVRMWVDAIKKTRQALDTQGDVSDGHLDIYFSTVDDAVADAESELAAARLDMITAGEAANSQLTSFLNRLATIEPAYTGHLSTINGLISSMTTRLAGFNAEYQAKLDELESAHTSHRADMLDLIANQQGYLVSYLTEHADKLNELHEGYLTHRQTVEDLLATESNQLTTYLADYAEGLATLEADRENLRTQIEAVIDELATLLATHLIDYSNQLDVLLSDYTAHAAIAEGLLDDLGTVERARINEQFDNLQRRTQQELMTRGLYSSGMYPSALARIERERADALTQLADRLAREQLENQHRLYSQKVEMRVRILDGTEKKYAAEADQLRDANRQRAQLHGQVQESLLQLLGSIDRRFGTSRDTWRGTMQQHDRLFAQLQEVLVRLADGVDRRHGLRQEVSRAEAVQREKLFTVLAEVNARTAEAAERLFGHDNAHALAVINQRDRLFAQNVDTKQMVLQGQERYGEFALRTGQFWTDTRTRITLAKLQANMGKAESRLSARDREEKLMAYQIDTRNNMLIGLWAFIERREDNYPSLDAMTRLIAGLGDSGGGWITP